MALKGGFEYEEARTLLEVVQQVYVDTPCQGPPGKVCDMPTVPPPSGWELVEDMTPGTVTLLDNYWQVWRNDAGSYAVSVRGTVSTAPSIFADLMLPLVNARFELEVGSHSLPFHLARDEGETAIRSGVHAGFALGLILMLFTTDKPLIGTLRRLARERRDVYITGHSQGASLATLLTSLVNHSTTLFEGPSYKSYVFAPAKSGNDHYAYDYADLVGMPGRGWALVSTQGWVPQAPLSIQGTWDLNTPNPVFAYGGKADPELPFLLREMIEKISGLGHDVVEVAGSMLDKVIEDLAGKLPAESVHLQAGDLGGSQEHAIDGSTLADVVKQLLAQQQASLNYALAGQVVPLYATPGGNPSDGTAGCQKFDFFWQHHLGNYLKYLEAQYGAGRPA